MTRPDRLAQMMTGIDGLDQITHGGLPAGRTTLVTGTAGSGKTLLAIQFVVTGILRFQQPGVICTFEESPDDLASNVRSLGWDLPAMIDDGRLAVVDATVPVMEQTVEAGAYDLSALLARIEHAVARTGATRVVLDAVGSLFSQLCDATVVRRELRRVSAGLRRLGVTALVTIERAEEDGPLGRFGVEEFVADNVLIVRNRIDEERRRRTLEVLKLRGCLHDKGEFPFTIDPKSGVTIVSLSAIELVQASSSIRVSSGVAELDTMCGGGLFRDSIILVSGATGTGKTLMVTEFVKAAIQAGERVLLFGAEESADQLRRNAASWGVDFAAAERDGLLRIFCRYPEMLNLEDHTIQMRRVVEEFKPDRVAVDSMSAFERTSNSRSFREFVLGMTSYLKQEQITGLFTNTAPMLIGGESVTETNISTITDGIFLLRYVELNGQMRRGIAVLKMRGTRHDRDIREYAIDGAGMRIGLPFDRVQGILTGSPTYSYARERDQLSALFSERPGPAEA